MQEPCEIAATVGLMSVHGKLGKNRRRTVIKTLSRHLHSHAHFYSLTHVHMNGVACL